MFRVAIGESISDLADVLAGNALAKAVTALQFLVELAASGELEDQVDSLLVPKVLVKPEDILVAEVSLNLDFAAQLVLDVVASQLVLVEDFDGHDELALPFAGEVNSAELAASEATANVKVLQAPARSAFEHRRGDGSIVIAAVIFLLPFAVIFVDLVVVQAHEVKLVLVAHAVCFMVVVVVVVVVVIAAAVAATALAVHPCDMQGCVRGRG
mmetsp:Transcript_13013/g.36661  ORF Transcript_13013/g.36661 Transcript_13013/m.36661 type:complete len:212 (+) Transcript_13013:643-1278(+)